MADETIDVEEQSEPVGGEAPPAHVVESVGEGGGFASIADVDGLREELGRALADIEELRGLVARDALSEPSTSPERDVDPDQLSLDDILA